MKHHTSSSRPVGAQTCPGESEALKAAAFVVSSQLDDILIIPDLSLHVETHRPYLLLTASPLSPATHRSNTHCG